MVRIVVGFAFVAVFLSACVMTSGRLEGMRSRSDSPHGYQIVTSPVRAGLESQRFEVRPGDCAGRDCTTDRERSEISLRDRFPPGTVRWVAYSIYLPSDFPTSSRVTTSLGQIHQEGGPSGTAGGFPSFPPLLQMQARGGLYEMCLHILTGPADNIRDECRDFDLSTISAMRGRWTDVMIHIDSRDTGLLEVFINGQRKVRTTDFIRFAPEEYFVKYGVYRSFVSRQGGPIPTQIAYYDEVRIGSDMASVLVNPERPVD